MLRALNRAVRRYLLRRGGAGIDTPGSLPAAQFFGRAIILATAILAVSASSDGTPPRKLTLSTASLSFGSQTVGNTGAAKPVTLTNSGTATLTISSIAVSGD